MWDGMLLVCPACRKGRIYRSFTKMNDTCAHCGAVFEPDEGDFVGAMVVAYSITAVLVAIGVGITTALLNLTFVQHVVIWSVFATVFILLTYRNQKGIWIGILHIMTGLKKGEPTQYGPTKR